MLRSAASTVRRATTPAAGDEGIRLAAIDVGSNSIHMIVAQAAADGGVTTLWRVKEMVGLGRGSFPARRLPNALMDRAVETLRRFKLAARRRQCEKVIAVATSAVREAENGGDFIERARSELGINIRVVSAREEARLIYLGVRERVDLAGGPHFITDIGGGSTEFVVADEHRAVLLESRKLGAARMTARYIKSDPVDAKEIKNLLAHYALELGPLCEQIVALKPVKAIGTSGTLENLSAMSGGLSAKSEDGFCGVIVRARLKRVVAEQLESRTKDRAKMKGLDSQRQDQIIAGALLAAELMERIDVKEIHITNSALREGILADYLEKHLPELVIRRQVPDPRRRSVLDLARRCDWHQLHAEHVAKLALQLFDQLKGIHNLDAKARELIEYGALLHDIGWHIAGNKHHKHSMYLVLNGDLKVFTDEETQVIANIARYHRKSDPSIKHESFAVLSNEARQIVRVGSALLRLADGLDRSHCRVITEMKCRVLRSGVDVRIEGKGDAELDIWGARRKMGLFAEVFQRSISFEQTKR